MKNGEMHFIINTPSGQQPRKDEVIIRSAAVAARVAMMTTLRGAQASAPRSARSRMPATALRASRNITEWPESARRFSGPVRGRAGGFTSTRPEAMPR